MGYIPPVHDYILCFGKCAGETSLFGFPLSQEHININYSNPDNDPRGLWTTSDLSANHKGPHFPIKNPNTGVTYYPPEGRYWVFNKIAVKEKIADGRIIFGRSGKSAPVQKKFLSEKSSQRVKAESWWDSHGINSDGTKELSSLLGKKKIFDHPKPTQLIKNLLTISSKNNDLVLDYFAGTLPTAQAALELDMEENNKRRFIMVQLPEPCDKKSKAFKEGYSNISEIGKERLRRVGNKIKKQNPLFVGDIGFRVFKLDTSNIHPWQAQKEGFDKTLCNYRRPLVEGRSEQDILYELLLKLGLDLTTPIEEKIFGGKTVYNIGLGALMVCLAKKITRDDVEPLALGILDWWRELASEMPIQFVFRDSSFVDNNAKINMTTLLKQSIPAKQLHNIHSL